ncbi:hypothetical protein H8S90_00960 [Olivibacter sp. SDN3]|nr:hypothetical protein H8S90_00960 [Olivibacter sp. SDN3]
MGLKVLYSGLLVGTFDILAALVNYYLSTGKNPLFVFKYIASGLFGTDAFSGGIAIILAGLLLHYIIAMVFAVVFYLLYFNAPILSAYKIVTGIMYGVFVWTIMNLIVVPLSQTPKSAFNGLQALKEMLILIVMIGLPLSFLAHYFFSIKNRK